jgi:hypothetical protein
MKTIIVLILFIVGIAVIIAFNLGSQVESESVTPQEPVVIAKPTSSDGKQQEKVVLPDAKVERKDSVVSKTIEHEVVTTSDIRKEAKKEVGEIKIAVEQINKSIPKAEVVDNEQDRLNAKENTELRELKQGQPSQDYSQMATTTLASLLIRPSSENEKVEILKALGNKKTEAKESLGNIMTVMATGSDLERAYAAKTIGSITQDDKDAFAKLMVALKSDKDENVRKEALRSIGEFKLNIEQVKELEAIMLTEKNERVRSKIQIAINKANLKN